MPIDPKKSNHQVNIVRIAELLPHTNADSLSLVHLGGYQLVVRKGQFRVGDLAVFVQPDSVVPQTEAFKFIWEGSVGLDGTVPEKRRRVTVRKFRGEYSEGLLLPLGDFVELGQCSMEVREGQDVSDLLGVTHYDPDTATANTKGNDGQGPRRKFRLPRTFKGWVKFIFHLVTGRGRQLTQPVPFTIPTYDVEAFKNYTQALEPFEHVIVSEKIHGSNARFLYLEGVMYAGSRSQWKAPGSGCVWRKALEQNPWIERWCRAHEGYALYGEVTPTQGSFNYGTSKVQFFVFDILSPERKWVSYLDYGTLGVNEDEEFLNAFVPILYIGAFIPDKVLALVDGISNVPGTPHIREGIVIRTTTERSQRGLGRVQLKVVSNDFLAKDSK